MGDDSTVTNDRSVAANYLAFKGMGAAVEWRAMALKWPTINSTESEAAAIAGTHTAVMFMRDHLSQLGIPQTSPTTIHSDSDPAVRNMYRFTSATASRHLNNLLAYRLDGVPLALENGAPLRAMVPDLYFWKSAKWVTGLRFVEEDAPGYWETRGYHNRADPWEEQRYALF